MHMNRSTSALRQRVNNASCLHLLYLMSELSCEYFHSTHLACWFGQMLTKAISWMKSLIVSPMPRGIPISPVRSWILVTCIIYASATQIRVLEPHSDARWAVRFRSHVTHFTVTYPPPLLLWACSYATISAVMCIIGVLVINCWAVSAQPCIIFSTPGIFLLWSRLCLPVRRNSSLLVRKRDRFLNKYFYWKTGHD